MAKSVPFTKYHGTGNDFVLINNLDLFIGLIPSEWVRKVCHRRFGVGADGLILLQNKKGYDFEMVYFNSDGNLSSMCGNGGRCITAFARRIGIISDHCRFLAADGSHEASLLDYNEDTHEGLVSLKMADVAYVEEHPGYFFLNTGSPHYVCFVNDIKQLNVLEEGKKIRNQEPFRKEGTNVNFVMKEKDQIHVRTYERGVEDETWSCGTGVTAVALVIGFLEPFTRSCNISTPGGSLRVLFEPNGKGFKEIYLQGSAIAVFDGRISID